MAMLHTDMSDRVYVSVMNAKNVVRLRLGPSDHGPAGLTELRPAEARKIALFLLQCAEKVGAAQNPAPVRARHGG